LTWEFNSKLVLTPRRVEHNVLIENHKIYSLAPAGAAFDPFNQGTKGPAPPLEKKAEDR
jgi:hypothetical protein